MLCCVYVDELSMLVNCRLTTTLLTLESQGISDGLGKSLGFDIKSPKGPGIGAGKLH